MAIFSSLQAATNITLVLKQVFTVEENNSLKQEAKNILATENGLNGIVNQFETDIKAITTKAALKTKVQASGLSIFNSAYQKVQNSNIDDRPLYWARNKMNYLIKELMNLKPELSDSSILSAFESKSRGFDDINFSGLPATTKKVLITGYDPFYLNLSSLNIKQSNPSGAAAMFLHNKTLSHGGKTAKIQVAILPVRYGDFDRGLIDSFFNKYFIGSNKVDMIITLSQGTKDRYDVERFAAKYREPNALIDNLDLKGGGASFYVPTAPGSSSIQKNTSNIPEFLETTLPFQKMVPGTTSFNNIQTIFNEGWEAFGIAPRAKTLVHQSSPPIPSTTNIPTSTMTSKNGSGGNYLSNEVFYRVALLRTKHSSNVKTGHLHVPNLDELANYELDKNKTYDLAVKVENMVKDAISGL